MFLTKFSQMPPENNKFWSSYQNGDKSFTRRCPGVSDDVSTQVCSRLALIYGICDKVNLLMFIVAISHFAIYQGKTQKRWAFDEKNFNSN